MAQIFKGRVYGSSPYPSAEINYEYKRDGANMLYRFTGRIYLENTYGWYYNNLQLNLYLNGGLVHSQNCQSSNKGWSIDFNSGWKTVTNKTSGTTPFYFSVKDTQNTSWCNYTSGTYNLAVSPAYANITKFNINKLNETSVIIDWSASDTCDYVAYSIDNGSTWSTLNSDNIVTGLTANTTYNFKLRVRRQDSQLITDSTALAVTTYDYPHVTAVGVADLIIGESQKLTLYNPLYRSVTIKMYHDDIELFDYNTDDTTVEFTPNEATLYSTIPNDQVGKCVYTVIFDNISTKTTTGDYTYRIKGTEVPIFNDFTYKDSNTVVTDVTGNDQVLIKGLSTLEVTIPSSNKMEAVHSALPNNYVINIDNLSSTVEYSIDDVISTIGTVVSSGTKRLNVRAYDSRMLSTLSYKDITVYDYSKPVVNATVTRLNNFESQTTVKVAGTYTRLTIDGVDKNTITNVEYRYREAGGNWSNYTTLNTSVSKGKYTCSDVIISLDNTKEFDIELRVTDKLSNNTATNKVGVGQAIFMISSNKKKCYINGDEVATLPAVNEMLKDIGDIDLGGVATKDDLNNMLQTIYPVGSIYISATNTNPSILFNFGTWEQVKDTFLLACGDNYEAGSIGGSKEHSHSIPVHNHGLSNGFTALNVGSGGIQYLEKQVGAWGTNAAMNIASSYNSYVTKSWGIALGGTTDNNLASNTGTTNNLPPYIAVYMWKRIS